MGSMSTPFMSTNSRAINTLLKCPEPHQHALLADFFAHALQENFNYFPKAAQDFYLAINWQTQRGLLTCAWQAEKIIGFVLGTLPEGGVGTIIWLIVDKQFQSKGIGKLLLDQAKTYYRNLGAHKIKLTVQSEKAIQFYLREGFEKEALHKKHWWQMDFWSMVFYT